eukprot:7934631-Pyramimonas_sp.AAC.1
MDGDRPRGMRALIGATTRSPRGSPQSRIAGAAPSPTGLPAKTGLVRQRRPRGWPRRRASARPSSLPCASS